MTRLARLGLNVRFAGWLGVCVKERGRWFCDAYAEDEEWHTCISMTPVGAVQPPLCGSALGSLSRYPRSSNERDHNDEPVDRTKERFDDAAHHRA
jgi:hypothetical protein